VELKLVQDGNDLTGTVRTFNCTAEWLNEGIPEYACQPLGEATYAITEGTVSSTRVTFKMAGMIAGSFFTWDGSFTTDLMSGTVHYPQELDAAGVGYRGNFNVHRQG
jgi:hypothetical protein